MDAIRWILILAVIAAGIYFLNPSLESFVSMEDMMENDDDDDEEEDAEEEGFSMYDDDEEEDADEEEDVDDDEEEMYEPADGDYVSQGGVSTRLMSSSQSPGEDDDFTEFAPRLTDQNFLEGKRFIGLDTKGSTLRNPSLDLRGNIPVQKIDVPWLNSTIEADTRPGI
jgi:hypothetical protein